MSLVVVVLVFVVVPAVMWNSTKATATCPQSLPHSLPASAPISAPASAVALTLQTLLVTCLRVHTPRHYPHPVRSFQSYPYPTLHLPAVSAILMCL